jgi:hypothetical protein
MATVKARGTGSAETRRSARRQEQEAGAGESRRQ